MRIESIEIIGMHKVNHAVYNLNEFTYLHGKNGAGKSTVMQAIQLALLGYIPGTDKNKTAIFHHANGPQMSVNLKFDDGTAILRSWIKDGKDIKATVATIPVDLDVESLLGTLTLPICDFNEFIGMTANKLKDWFIKFLPNADSSLDWDAELRSVVDLATAQGDPKFESNVADAVDMLNKSTDTLANLQVFNAFCKEQVSATKNQAFGLQATIRSLVYYDDFNETVSAEAVKAQMTEKEIIRDGIKQKLYKYQTNLNIKNKLSQLGISEFSPAVEENAEFCKLKQIIAEHDTEIADFKAKVETLNNEIHAAIAESSTKENIISKGGICPFTDSLCGEIHSKIPDMKSEVAYTKQKIDSFYKTLAEYKTTLGKLQTERDVAANKVAKIRTDYRDYESLMSQYDSSVDMNITPEELNSQAESIKAEVENLRQTLVKIEANQKYNELSAKLCTEKYQLESRTEIYKAWEKISGVNGLQSRIMIAPFVNFSATLSGLLQKFFNDESCHAKFNIGEKANSFSFGIANGDKFIDYDFLSSGEKCLFTLALLIAMNLESTSDIKLLLVDDLLDHLDPIMVQQCFTTLYNNTDVQLIIAGIHAPVHSDADKFVLKIGD